MSDWGSVLTPVDSTTDIGPTDDQPVGDNEASKGANFSEVIRRVSAHKEALLGPSFLGKRLFLCYGRRTNEEDDRRIPGASF